MKRYQGYKDSGVSWIGEIPVDWSIKKLKYYTTTNDEVLTETLPQTMNSVMLISEV